MWRSRRRTAQTTGGRDPSRCPRTIALGRSWMLGSSRALSDTIVGSIASPSTLRSDTSLSTLTTQGDQRGHAVELPALRSYPSRGGKGIRTPDLLTASQALYQLSYTPEARNRLSAPRRAHGSSGSVRGPVSGPEVGSASRATGQGSAPVALAPLRA